MGAQWQWWGADILRNIIGGLDWAIFQLVKVIIQGIFDISNLTASPSLANGIYARIYVILGIFMVFKLSFSFFSYIVDPESMSSKDKGVGKLITNTIVMLMLLVTLPSLLFGTTEEGGLIIRAQNALLPMLPRILLGVKDNTGAASGNASVVSEAADRMATAALIPFFSPAGDLAQKCIGNMPNPEDMQQITSIDEFASKLTTKCKNTQTGVVGLFSTHYYVYHYTFLISTIVGVVLLVTLLSITLDVAKRVFKLIILQMIAPVPIMSYIDPKSSKDGAFAAWLKLLTSTFLEIFIKLGTLYVVLMFIDQIIIGGLWKNLPNAATATFRYFYVQLFMIIGLLLFAKDAPKFVKDALGIKDNGKGGGFLEKALAMPGRALTGAAAGFVSGGLAGMATGAMSGATSDPKQSAWRAGGDKAKQMATGDKNAKSGIMNSLAERATKAQGNRAAGRLNVSEDSISAAKDHMYKDEDEAKMAEMVASKAGATQDQMKTAIEARKKAIVSKSNYDKMNAAGDSFGINRSEIQQRQDTMKQNNLVHRASRSVGNALTQNRAAQAIANSGVGQAVGNFNTQRSQSLEARSEARTMQSISNNPNTVFDPYMRSGADLNRDMVNREQAAEMHSQAARPNETAARESAARLDQQYQGNITQYTKDRNYPAPPQQEWTPPRGFDDDQP